MEKYDVQSWTVEKERQLYEDELEINWKISTSWVLSKDAYSLSERKSVVSIYYIYQYFWQRKLAQKISKLRSDIKYDDWVLKTLTNKQDIVAGILENCEGSENKRIKLSGDRTIPRLNSKFIDAFTFAWTRASADTKISLQKFWLSHKQFWRMIFAMRHIKQIKMYSCRLIEVKAIHDEFHIIGFSPTDISFIFSEFISIDATSDKNEAYVPLIKTLWNLQKKNIGLKDDICLDLTLCSVNDKSFWYNLKEEDISNGLKIFT